MVKRFRNLHEIAQIFVQLENNENELCWTKNFEFSMVKIEFVWLEIKLEIDDYKPRFS